MTAADVAVTLTCRTHGRVVLDADAVFLRLVEVPEDGTFVRGVIAACDGHVIRYTPTPTERAALTAAGVLEIDAATVTLLTRLVSPSAVDLADQAIAETDVRQARHLLVGVYGAVGRRIEEAIQSGDAAEIGRLTALQTAFRRRAERLRSGGAR